LLFLPAGQRDEPYRPSQKQGPFGKKEALDGKVVSLFYTSKG